jgi:cell division protein FtsL
MVVIDLKIFSGEGHTSAFRQKEMADELWSNYILPIDGLCAHARIQAMRKTLQLRIPVKVATCYDPKRPAIPIETGHPI